MIELNTFSIVASCARTGHLGMAVSSAVPAAGALCLYGKQGIGVVSTQSWVNPYLAIQAIELMAHNHTAQEALEAVLKTDPQKHLRQIGLADAEGNNAAWTGDQCTDFANHIVGENFAIQGNMLTGAQVLDDMVQAFCGDPSLDLSERLMLTLEAGQVAGGDKRGKQSAAMIVYEDQAYASVDLRVDDHGEPIKELRRVLDLARLQLMPFVAAMPKLNEVETSLPASISAMLLLPPEQRPGAPESTLDAFTDLLGTNLDDERLQADLKAFSTILTEIKKLRKLDLSDVHPAVVFTTDELTRTRS